MICPFRVALGSLGGTGLLLLSGCGAPADAEAAGTGQASTVSADKARKDAGVTGDAGAPGGQASADFRAWLEAHGYGSYNFPRDDVAGGSFGGKSSARETVTHTPIVFVHGNTDSALGTFESEVGFATSPYTGFTASVAYFTAHGYSMAELYGTTWGTANENDSSTQEHSRAYVKSTRAFLEAVLAYTGAEKVDVIAHSMGVTLARGALYGGTQVDSAGSYSVGSALGSRVDTFIGISAANLGLALCFDAELIAPACNGTAGFYPGVLDIFGNVDGAATYLTNLQKKAGKEGAYRFAIYSLVDEVIGEGDLIYGQYTSRLPDETGEITYDSYPYGHVGSKDLSAAVQYDLVTTHAAKGLAQGRR